MYMLLEPMILRLQEMQPDELTFSTAEEYNNCHEVRAFTFLLASQAAISQILKEMIKNDLNEEIEKTKAFINKCDKEIYGEAKP